jgi:class 3 adenylate cyclase/tetratricopeptide (TPR) repeat protein
MTFKEVMDQAITWLQKDQRISYRALKRQFALEDDSLDDLKVELIEVKRVAVDHDGLMLVWTGASCVAEPDTRSQAEAERHLFTVLPAVLALLQREHRVTYRTLRAVFGVDEACLHAIRDELRFRQLAREESGQGLVWTGMDPPPAVSAPYPVPATAPARSAALPRPLLPPPDVPQPLPEPTPALDGVSSLPVDDVVSHTPEAVPGVTPALAPSVPEAERRQLTVMFCDLVGSTQLSGQLDPEDLRAVVRAYQEAAAAVIQTYAGHIAQYLGDGLLIYFGYPTAHEDDARRAVHTGLGTVEAIATLNTRLAAQYGVQLTVRLGIHTGPVVVGVMGGGGRHEHLALGETPNIAARLQALAPANTVVISTVTARLVQGTFALEELGTHALHGIAEPMRVSRVRGLLATPSHDEECVTAGVPLLVGREEESGLLRRRWDQSKAGLGQVVCISGEAGIGKSALVESLRAQVRVEGLPCIAFRCSPYHTNSALYPVITHLEHLLQLAPDDPPATKLAKLEAGLQPYDLPLVEAVPLVAGLLSIPLPAERYAPLPLTPQHQKQQTLDALLAWMVAEAERQPVLVAWEDLHWADPTTLEMLGLVIEQAPTVPMLHVLTYRPAFSPPWPPRSHMTPLVLHRLERLQVEALITQRAGGKTLPVEVVQYIVAKTDGVPLYVEELTKMLLASPLLRAEADRYVLTGPLHTVAIPDTLQDALMARLDQLNRAKEVVQLGAVLGREFPYKLLQAIAPQDEDTLQAELAQLVTAELLYQRGRPPRARYVFKHALIQDAAYQSLLRSTRQQYHQRSAQVLAERFPETAETQPEVIAQHYTAAGLHAQALPYWQQAGQLALTRSAYRETVACYEQALVALEHLPDSRAAAEQAIDLRLGLRSALRPLGDKGRILAYLREAETLAEALDDPRRLGQVWRFLTAHFCFMGVYDQAIAAGQRALALATAGGDGVAHALANQELGYVYRVQGSYRQAIDCFRQTVVALDRAWRHERFGHVFLPAVQSRALLAECHAALGMFAEGAAFGNEGLQIAEAVAHPASLMVASWGTGLVSLRQGDLPQALPRLERAMSICRQADLPLYFPMVAGALGEVYILAARFADAVRLLTPAMEQRTGEEVIEYQARCRLSLGEAQLRTGRLEEALALAKGTLASAREHQERGHEAYALRLLGEIQAHRDPLEAEQAEAAYRETLALAEALGMCPLQAHCHRGLGTLYAATGQREQARAALSAAVELYQTMEMTFWLPETEAALAQVQEG